MKAYRAEFHVHTVLSPCAEIEMIPPLIVEEALSKGIHWIAITDHNASANVEAVMKAAKGTDLAVSAGMEVQTQEEIHSLCLFDTLDQILAFQQFIDAVLPPLENQPDYFGEQLVVDETGDFIRRETRLLLNSASISIREAWEKTQELDGLLIPAHIDRKAFGMIANLGLIPIDTPVEALEISRHLTPESARSTFPQIGQIPLIKSGDAHRLNEFLGVNLLRVEAPRVKELRKALANREDRTLTILDTDQSGNTDVFPHFQ